MIIYTPPHLHSHTLTHTFSVRETKLIIRSGKTFPLTALCRNFSVSWDSKTDDGEE